MASLLVSLLALPFLASALPADALAARAAAPAWNASQFVPDSHYKPQKR
jgi:glucan 1,3-beta-glucosidase